MSRSSRCRTWLGTSREVPGCRPETVEHSIRRHRATRRATDWRNRRTPCRTTCSDETSRPLREGACDGRRTGSSPLAPNMRISRSSASRSVAPMYVVVMTRSGTRAFACALRARVQAAAVRTTSRTRRGDPPRRRCRSLPGVRPRGSARRWSWSGAPHLTVEFAAAMRQRRSQDRQIPRCSAAVALVQQWRRETGELRDQLVDACAAVHRGRGLRAAGLRAAPRRTSRGRVEHLPRPLGQYWP